MNPATENPMQNKISSRFNIAATLREKTQELRYNTAVRLLSLGRTFFVSDDGKISKETNDRPAAMFLGKPDCLKIEFIKRALDGLGVPYDRIDENYKPYKIFAPNYVSNATSFILNKFE
jgi:hypothetical protein